MKRANTFLSRLSRSFKLCYTTAPRTREQNYSQYLLLSIPVTAFCLGTWQVKRLAWKTELIRDMQSRISCPAVELPRDLTDMEYKRVSVRGTFDHSRELYLGPRSKRSNEASGGLVSERPDSGYHVITAFVLQSGERILVNRGWVPMSKKDPKTRLKGQIAGEVVFTGLVRHGEQKPRFAPSIDENSTFWHYCNVNAFSNLLHANPVLIDADVTVDDGPIGGQTRVNIRNEHLQYIVTWYSLSALTFIIFFKFRKGL